jgi:hypothetical protein
MSTDDKPNSMFARAVHDAAEETGGRFARNTQVSIAGTSAIPHADKLAGPEWSQDHVPPEAPLGTEIDWVPDMTTVDGSPREATPAPEAEEGEEP